MKIRMKKTVISDLPALRRPGLVLYKDEEYEATSNPRGAICGICDNGEKLGVKPGEFEFVEAPKWILDIWDRAGTRNAKVCEG